MSMSETVDPAAIGRLRKRRLRVIQVNVGYSCNQACTHCHVRGGPDRSEVAGRAVFDAVLAALDRMPEVEVVDVTGGAPERVPDLPAFLDALVGRGRRVMYRTNLTALLETSTDHLLPRLAALGAEIVASLPCYQAPEVDAVRGEGVFDRSLEGLRLLNAAGWGAGNGRVLSLMFNPEAAFLPPAQPALEAEYREVLGGRHGIAFDRVLTLANVPLGRFRDGLIASGTLQDYLVLLRSRFNPATLDRLMCLDTANVAWDGRLFDCDFHQAAGVEPAPGAPRTIRDLAAGAWIGADVPVRDHCLACTAGAGSSCGGSLIGDVAAA